MELQDADGKPVANGELHCFNHTLGLFYPDRIARKPLLKGRARVHLPRGDYTIIGATHGILAAARVTLRGDRSVILRPDSTIKINTRGHVRGGLLYAVPSGLRHCLPSYFMGPVRMPTSLAVNSGMLWDIMLWQPPAANARTANTFILRETELKGGQSCRLDSRDSNLACIRYAIADADGRPCPRYDLTVTIPPGSPSIFTISRDQNNPWKEVLVHIQPAKALIGRYVFTDGWVHNFYPTVLDLRARAMHDLRINGTLTPAVVCRPKVFPRNVLVELPTANEWGLHIALPPKGKSCGVVQFLDDKGNVGHEDDLKPTLDSNLSHAPKAGDRYRIKLDLGFFGGHELTGRFGQKQDLLAMMPRQTEHFEMLWPASLGERLAPTSRYMEGAFSAISAALGLTLRQKVSWSPLLFGPGGAGGPSMTTHLNYLKDPRSLDPDSAHWKGAMAHELGHVFQGTSEGLSDFGGPSPTCKEAFASIMSDVALQEMATPGAALLQRLGHRENFFRSLYRKKGYLDELNWPNDPACFGEYWRYYFILAHLTDVFGPSIHGKVARAWGEKNRNRNEHYVLKAEGWKPEEIVCATYSRAVGQDLGWLFRLGDFDVEDGLPSRTAEILARNPGR